MTELETFRAMLKRTHVPTLEIRRGCIIRVYVPIHEYEDEKNNSKARVFFAFNEETGDLLAI